jgi:hypothetical protein
MKVHEDVPLEFALQGLRDGIAARNTLRTPRLLEAFCIAYWQMGRAHILLRHENEPVVAKHNLARENGRVGAAQEGRAADR